MDIGQALKIIFSDEVPNIEEKVYILKGSTTENSENHLAIIV